jgi:tRNA(Ile)-lysidine synthase
VNAPSQPLVAVRGAVRRSLDDLERGSLALVACSGGPDSLALAAATASVAPRMGLRAGGVTVDHGLQEGSADRAEIVAATLRGLGLGPVEVIKVDVGNEGGPEGAARTARYSGLDEAALRFDAAAVLLGHTLDDQAESVLLGLARGSGTRSLSGMAAVNGVYRRPFLDLTRETTHAACIAADLTYWADPHNEDHAFARVRVRTEVLPMIERELGPGTSSALARSARLLREDADALDSWAEHAVTGSMHPNGGLSTEAMQRYPAAVRRRVYRTAAIATGAPAGALTAAHLDTIDRLVTHWRGQGPIALPGGVSVWREQDRLLFAVLNGSGEL